MLPFRSRASLQVLLLGLRAIYQPAGQRFKQFAAININKHGADEEFHEPRAPHPSPREAQPRRGPPPLLPWRGDHRRTGSSIAVVASGIAPARRERVRGRRGRPAPEPVAGRRVPALLPRRRRGGRLRPGPRPARALPGPARAAPRRAHEGHGHGLLLRAPPRRGGQGRQGRAPQALLPGGAGRARRRAGAARVAQGSEGGGRQPDVPDGDGGGVLEGVRGVRRGGREGAQGRRTLPHRGHGRA